MTFERNFCMQFAIFDLYLECKKKCLTTVPKIEIPCIIFKMIPVVHFPKLLYLVLNSTILSGMEHEHMYRKLFL